MKKFKKFYIALLGGILALGVGTGSLVSSVSPTKVEAAVSQVVTINFSNLGLRNGNYVSVITYDGITFQANPYDAIGGERPYYSSDGYIIVQENCVIDIFTSTGTITQIDFTFVNGYSLSSFERTSPTSGDINIVGNTITFSSSSVSYVMLENNATEMRITQIDVSLSLPGVEKTITANFSNLEGFLFGEDLFESTKLEYDYITVYFTNSEYMSSYINLVTFNNTHSSINISTSLGVITKIEFTISSGSISNFTSDTTFDIDGNTLIFDDDGVTSVSLLNSISDTWIRQIVVTLELNRLEEAIYWADSFYNGIVCDNGVTPPDTEKWAELEEEYAELTSDAKTYFANDRTKNASQSIENAILKYDYIINKYGNNGNYNYTNFIGRTPEISSANTISSVTNSIDYITITAIVMSVVALTSIGAFIIIYRKRKLSSK